MIRKVVDYGLFMRTIGMGSVNGARNKPMFMQELKAEYPPEDGWEIVGTHIAGQSPEGWVWGIFLQKIEFVSEAVGETSKDA